MGIPAPSSVDLDACIDVEEQQMCVGYDDGDSEGQREASKEGARAGAERGFEYGQEIGYYAGALLAWRRHSKDLSRGALSALAALERALASVPRDPSDERVHAALADARARWRQAVAVTGNSVAPFALADVGMPGDSSSF